MQSPACTEAPNYAAQYAVVMLRNTVCRLNNRAAPCDLELLAAPRHNDK
jgi:hypothetical protein